MLLDALTEYFSGYTVVVMPKGTSDEDVRRLLGMLMCGQIMYRGMKTDRDGGVKLRILGKDCKKLRSLLDKNGRGVYIMYDGGFPSLIRRYRKRPGILLGAVCFFALIAFSTRFVWSIEAQDTGEVTAQEIISALDDAGLRVGSRIPELDLYSVCNRALASSEKIGWISVNIEGTKAVVQIRPAKQRDETYTDTSPTNIVAARDGVIRSLTVGSGCRAVSDGDSVSEGQILISGVVDNKNGSYRLTRAFGAAYAVTRDTLETAVPFEYTEKTAAGKTYSSKTVSILGRDIRLYLGEKIPRGDHITETVSGSPVIFGFIRLPFVLTDIRRTECVEVTSRLSKDEARAAAEAQMAELIAETSSDGELLESSTRIEVTEDEYRIIAEITVLRDIGREVPLGAADDIKTENPFDGKE